MARPSNSVVQTEIDLPPLTVADAKHLMEDQVKRLDALLAVARRQLTELEKYKDTKFEVEVTESPYKFVTGVKMVIKL